MKNINYRNRLLLWSLMPLFAILACQAVSGSGANPTVAALTPLVGASQPAPGGLQPISPADVQATQLAAAAAAGNQPATPNAPPTASNAQGAAAAPPTATPIPCDKVSFVKDVTIPDNTTLAPGNAFTKTWRLKNDGSCTWNSGYKLVFDRGDALGGPQDVPLTTGTVAPGQTVDVSVNLTAPAQAGTYQGYWKLRNSSGVLFGWGDKANAAFWVKIKVEATAQQPPASTKKNVTLAPTSNGGSVDSNGGSNIGFIPGDDTSNLTWVTFMDFSIVDIPPTATIHSATLTLPCIWVAGDPFNELGEVGVFYSYYGNFNPAVLSKGIYDLSQYLGSLKSCPDTPLDVTASLRANLGPPYYQIIALFQFGTDSNADDDYIQITTPSLKIEYTP